jgi:BMFP domain-containing protein YqiC
MPAVLACPLQGEAPVEPKISSHDVAVSLAGSVPEMYRRTLAAMIDGHKISSLIPLPLIDCCSKQAIDPSTGISKVEESQETLEDFPKEIVSKSDGEADVETSSKAHDSSVPAVSEPKADVETASKAHDSSVLAVSEPKADVEAASKAHDSSVPAVSESKADVETASKAHDSSVPAVSESKADVETASKAHDSSVPAVSEPKADVETTSKAHDSSVPAVSKPKVAKVAMVPHKGLGARIKTWLGCVQASAAEPKSLKAAKKAKSKPAMKTQ